MAEDTARRYHEIKRNYSEPGARMLWIEGAGDHWKEKSEKDTDPQTEDLNNAFDALAPYINEPLGHTKEQSQGVRVLGIKMKYSKDGELSITISAARPIAGHNAPLAINIPPQVPAAKLLKCVEDLEHEATLYLEGKKAQIKLELEPDQAEA